MMKIHCNQCGKHHQPFIDFFDGLEVKEHIVICSLVQHGLIDFSDVGYDGSTDSCAQSWISINKFSRTDPVRHLVIRVMEPHPEIRWTTADGTVVASCTTHLYGVFLEAKYYLEQIRS